MSVDADHVVLRPNARQRLWWGVLAVLLLGGLAARVIDGPALRGWDWLGMVFLALLGLVMVAYTIGARLELTRDGFRVWPNIRSPRTVPWDRVDDLHVIRGAYGTVYVEYTLRPEHPPPSGDGKKRRRGVPTWYGMKADQQLRLMMQFRARFGRIT